MDQIKEWDNKNYRLWEETGKDIKELNLLVSFYLKELLKIDFPFEIGDLGERDLLEVTIEGYLVIWCVLHKKDYATIFDTENPMNFIFTSKVLKDLYDYKLLKFGKEYLEEMGLEVVDVGPGGFKVREKKPTLPN